MARKNRTPEENARREKIRELLQLANIGSMDDIQNLFKETIAKFMENGLEAELDEEAWLQQIRLQKQRHGQQPERPQQQDAAHQLWRCGGISPAGPEGRIRAAGAEKEPNQHQPRHRRKDSADCPAKATLFSASKTSLGVFHPRHFLGRLLIRSTTSWSSLSDKFLKS